MHKTSYYMHTLALGVYTKLTFIMISNSQLASAARVGPSWID